MNKYSTFIGVCALCAVCVASEDAPKVESEAAAEVATAPAEPPAPRKPDIDDKDLTLRELAELIYAGEKDGRRSLRLGMISDEKAKEIETLTGIQTQGRGHSIQAKMLRENYKKHGPRHKEGKKMRGEDEEGRLPVTVEDIARLPEIYENYDRVEKFKNTGNGVMIKYTKNYPDGTLVVLECLYEDPKRSMGFKDMIKREPKEEE